ncbi:MAG: hypothetical protein GZ088_06865 [Acidipila sp.]|nr:hypothetical protein [Acidipila sp.]
MAKVRQFVIDERGVKVAVVLDIAEYEKLLEDLDDLQAIQEYEEAKASGETAIPLEQALSEIRSHRK